MKCAARFLEFSLITALVAWSAAIAEETIGVPALPGWQRGVEPPAVVLRVGDQEQWDVTPRGEEFAASASLDKPQARGALLPVAANSAITLRVSADAGVPVMMLVDGPLYVPDPALMQVSDPDQEPLPGNPVAYAIGDEEGDELTISVAPPHNAVWQLWAWILPGELSPPEDLDIPEEMLESMRAMGYSEEQLAEMKLAPDIRRAWEAVELEDYVGNSLSSPTISVSVSAAETPGREPQYVMREFELLMIPAAAENSRATRLAYFDAIDRLNEQRSTALATICHTIARAEVSALLGIDTDSTNSVRFAAQYPSVVAPLIRRHYERANWAEVALEASELFARRLGTQQEIQLIQARQSQDLARLLKTFNGLSGVVVDIRGNVIAATARNTYANISDSADWAHVEQAEGDSILVTEPTMNEPYGFHTRDVAVPINLPDEDTRIGWLLATVLAPQSVD